MTSFFSNVTWAKFVYASGRASISFLEIPGCSSDFGCMIPPDTVILAILKSVKCISAALAYRQKWHMPRAPRFRGPAHLRNKFFCARVNCGIASWIVFTTAILHWHNILQHIRGNIRARVEYTPMLLTRLDGFDTGKATE